MTATKKLEEIKQLVVYRINRYTDFAKDNVLGKKFADIDNLTWEKLSAYSAEKELAMKILEIIENN